jgi:hypothetical protein
MKDEESFSTRSGNIEFQVLVADSRPALFHGLMRVEPGLIQREDFPSFQACVLYRLQILITESLETRAFNQVVLPVSERKKRSSPLQ